MQNDVKYRSTLEVSIRRKHLKGLPGDDNTLHNLNVGSSLKGSGPLRGLDYDEEILYLPEIIGISPTDNEWRKSTIEYWNNIRVPIPADGVGTNVLQGKVLKFTVAFKTAEEKDNFDKVLSFEEKAIISKRGEVIDGVADYILWRYCLVYSKVANRFEDVDKSPKILFYLYSKGNETLVAHKAFKARIKAQTLFTSILMKEDVINSVLLMFDQDLSVFENLQDKHLALDALIKTRAADFITFVEDTNLEIKSIIRTAVDKRILHRPTNTDSYYFGENNDVCLGATLSDAVLYWKSTEPRNAEIVKAITARLKQL